MQALSFPGYGRVEIIEIPPPALRDPGDAIVLVTTAAIGPWDVERFLSVSESDVVPGGEFAGLVVETGSAVSTVDLDDLVANTTQHSSGNGHTSLFGSTTLPGGHAEYVRVPDADKTLTKIADSGEERAVIAGGTIGLGVNAAALATTIAPSGTYAVVGCDPIGMTALIALSNTGAIDKLLAVEDHAARRTLASQYSKAALTGAQISENRRFDVVIVGAVRDYPGFDVVSKLLKPDGTVVFCEPYGSERLSTSGTLIPDGVKISAATWPTNVEAGKIVIALQIRRLDLTPLVSHVIPLDQAQEAYEAAAGPGAGVQKVLLKP
jgi:threonine dehydrogenase-like Zn-dependent dehydrogenase